MSADSQRGSAVFPVLLLGALLTAACSEPEEPVSGEPYVPPLRPNVVVVLVDALRADRLGC